MTNNEMVQELQERVKNVKNGRSAWCKGVKEYASEIIENLYDQDFPENVRLLEKALLNGAGDWVQYSWGGCSFCYNKDIAARLCNNTELRKTDNGRKKPNSNEEWLDVQARALYQACNLVIGEYKNMFHLWTK